MDIRGIVADFLASHGFDGLYNADAGCGCCLDDLFPCDGDMGSVVDCMPGYRYPCPQDSCGEHNFHIGTKAAQLEATKAEKTEKPNP
jgi:hypothetical protein